MSGRIALYGFVALVVAFIVLPIIAIVPAAFSAQSFIRLPPEAWSLRWWDAFFRDASWRVTLVTSLAGLFGWDPTKEWSGAKKGKGRRVRAEPEDPLDAPPLTAPVPTAPAPSETAPPAPSGTSAPPPNAP